MSAVDWRRFAPAGGRRQFRRQERKAREQLAAEAEAYWQSGAVRATDSWPDPHGPDKTVFGREPRVTGEAL